MVDSGTFKTTSYLQEMIAPGVSDVLMGSAPKDGSSIPRRTLGSSGLGDLDVCFGGFSPTVMGDMAEKQELVNQWKERQQAHRELVEKAAAIDAARASEVREASCNDALWKYVVLDDCEVRIERCETDEASLAIPDTLDGLPVVALAAEACADLASVTAVTIPDSVLKIGPCAFRGCFNLKSVEFPAQVATYDPGWLRQCPKVERIKLPGALDKVTSAVFDAPSLKSLEIGALAHEVMPGAFAKSQLAEVAVSPDNDVLSTDGVAIYSHEGAVMTALAVPCENYEVADGCVAIARKGFSNFAQLRQVALPDSLQAIDDYAYSKTGITSFVAPQSLRAIGERAFFACESLTSVTLNSGLMYVGSNAFSDTAIEELRLPSTIVELGHPIATGTSLTFAGEGATFSIGAGASAAPAEGQQLILDEKGALYRNAEDGLHLMRMLDDSAESYEAKPGTVAVDDGAFAKHPSITSVTLPEGVASVGKGAFKDCRNLTSVTLPETLATIGDEAFLGTSLESLRIPAALTRIGSVALVTEGAHHGTVEPSLRHVEVGEGNPRYYVEQGMLIEHLDNGSDRIILCTCEEPDIVIPEAVTGIAQYAFNGARRLRTLGVSDRLQMIDVRGLAFDCLLENLHVELHQPLEGRTSFDFEFPETSRAAQQMRLAFGSCNFLDIATIFDHYDNAIVSRSGFDAASEMQLGAYEQGIRVVARLSDPVCLTPNNRSLMEAALRNHLHEICVDAARHDDRSVIEGLLDLGFIDADNISEVIEAVSAVQDASVTNYLLEQKQRRFGSQGIDFAL